MSENTVPDAELEIHRDQTEPGVTRIVLTRAKTGNSLTNSLVASLAEAVAACYTDGTRMLVIEGSGNHFCTGFDLSGLDSETDDSLLSRFVRVELLLQSVHYAPFLTLALAHGRVFGAGADLFAACEERWILDSASFAFPGAAFGLVLGTARLARRVGVDRTRAWIREGRELSAAQALESGLATRALALTDLPEALAALTVGAKRLEPSVQDAIRRASLGNDLHAGAQDLQELVLSAARPGLVARIQAYRNAAKARR
ncbi:enoyl-CoA hydratase/isomerase family protein [Lacisediminimonas profundi]|uniref:enoyl-CoA hydratase/isomerase family protein n=1 Tax=Lacisediminimonas profundi TaxID=2603856 RepID=UPI00124B73B7|nr:enoyl-CoA hydratase/isomerase family protein [Lacisediminimonas profundi]